MAETWLRRAEVALAAGDPEQCVIDLTRATEGGAAVELGRAVQQRRAPPGRDRRAARRRRRPVPRGAGRSQLVELRPPLRGRAGARGEERRGLDAVDPLEEHASTRPSTRSGSSTPASGRCCRGPRTPTEPRPIRISRGPAPGSGRNVVVRAVAHLAVVVVAPAHHLGVERGADRSATRCRRSGCRRRTRRSGCSPATGCVSPAQLADVVVARSTAGCRCRRSAAGGVLAGRDLGLLRQPRVTGSGELLGVHVRPELAASRCPGRRPRRRRAISQVWWPPALTDAHRPPTWVGAVRCPRSCRCRTGRRSCRPSSRGRRCWCWRSVWSRPAEMDRTSVSPDHG